MLDFEWSPESSGIFISDVEVISGGEVTVAVSLSQGSVDPKEGSSEDPKENFWEISKKSFKGISKEISFLDWFNPRFKSCI